MLDVAKYFKLSTITTGTKLIHSHLILLVPDTFSCCSHKDFNSLNAKVCLKRYLFSFLPFFPGSYLQLFTITTTLCLKLLICKNIQYIILYTIHHSGSLVCTTLFCLRLGAQKCKINCMTRYFQGIPVFLHSDFPKKQ